MRAVWYERTGPAADVLVVGDMPTPAPGPGEALVRLRASGVNPSDVKLRAGQRGGASGMPYPRIVPHSDGAGVVEAVGDGVDRDWVGRRVWVRNAQWERPFGTAAEYVALPVREIAPLPESVSFAVGATLGIPAITAAHCVIAGGPVADRAVLVSGGAGVVGRLAVQVARASGAFVIATAGGAQGCASALAAGAHAALDYAAPDLADAILAVTGGRPVDLAVEVEFGANAETLARVMAPRGRIAAYGSAKALAPSLPFYPLLFKGVRLDFVLVYRLDDSELAAARAPIAALLDAGRLDSPIHAALPLDRAAEAHAMVERGGRAGAVVLEIP